MKSHLRLLRVQEIANILKESVRNSEKGSQVGSNSCPTQRIYSHVGTRHTTSLMLLLLDQVSQYGLIRLEYTESVVS